VLVVGTVAVKSALNLSIDIYLKSNKLKMRYRGNDNDRGAMRMKSGSEDRREIRERKRGEGGERGEEKREEEGRGEREE
jgi:hypothetical protein